MRSAGYTKTARYHLPEIKRTRSRLLTLNTEAEEGLYELYWNFENDAEIIFFAVRVQISGWIGFGCLPTDKMPDSDVVIGRLLQTERPCST